jgi:hypothetical protein
MALTPTLKSDFAHRRTESVQDAIGALTQSQAVYSFWYRMATDKHTLSKEDYYVKYKPGVVPDFAPEEVKRYLSKL